MESTKWRFVFNVHFGPLKFTFQNVGKHLMLLLFLESKQLLDLCNQILKLLQQPCFSEMSPSRTAS